MSSSPPAPRTPRAAPLDGADIVARAFKAEERFWTMRLRAHRCRRCEFGGRCRTFDDYAARADDAGKKAERAEGRRS